MREHIVRGRVIHLKEEIVKLPTGVKVRLDIVEHLGAALIVPFLSKDSIIFIRQYRPVIGQYLYELPAGTLKKGENILSCARRELTEETGYRAQKFTRVGHIYPVPGYSTEKIIIYKAENLIKTQVAMEEDEVIEPHIFSRRQIRSMLEAGNIVDAKTISALVFCRLL